MKVLLTTLNAKYIHSSLALRYLEKHCKSSNYELAVEEYTINDQLDAITAGIYKNIADIIAFSCYIWNISMIIEIADRIKKVQPDCIIIFGGPEVSYDAEDVLRTHEHVDYIVIGEGEETLKELLQYLSSGRELLEDIKGIAYRNQTDSIIVNECRSLIKNLDEIPSPYHQKDLEQLSGKLIYYETSRGCPFNCSYCLSSTVHGVRYFSIDRVKSDLLFLIKNGVKLVKFVDRTFNCDKKRTMEIFQFLAEHHKETSFHCEVAADLFDGSMIEFLSTIPEALIQFEIGVQSTNLDTIHAIYRKTSFDKLAANVEKIRAVGNIHLHLDLIAGLPEEDYPSFAQSFDDVYRLQPHVLQLGFLKLLKGSKIRTQSAEYEYKYTALPPYEILKSKWLSYKEILKLKNAEDVLEKYHNSGVFRESLRYILNHYYSSPFHFFEVLGDYFEKQGLNKMSHSRKALYDILYEFYEKKIKQDVPIFTQYLKFDLILNQKGAQLPYWCDRDEKPGFRERCFEFLKNEQNVQKYLPKYAGMPAKKIIKEVGFEQFKFDVLNKQAGTKGFSPTVILIDYATGKTYSLSQF